MDNLNEIVNLLFINLDLFDDLLLKLKNRPEIKHETKLRLNNLRAGLENFCGKVRKLDEIEIFDHDKQLLITLLEAESEATKAGKSAEFLNYILNFKTHDSL